MSLSLIFYTAMLYHAAFEYKTGSPDALFPVQNAIHDYSSPVVMMTPALLPFAGGLLLNSSAGRPYSEEILATGSSAIQYGTGDYGLQMSWNSFGADFYREHIFSLKAGYSIFPFLQAGVSENLYILKIDTDDLALEEKKPETDFAVLLSPSSWFNAAFIQTGLISLIRDENSSIIYPERSFGILIKPGNGFSLSWNITDTAAERVNTFSAAVNPSSFFSVKGGYCRENSSFAASFGVLTNKFFVSYGLRYHPYLGYTLSLGITYTLSPEIESLNYGKPLFSSAGKKINVKTATPDDLKKIDGLRAVSAERIIMYREKIGPVTEKSLMQIGLTGEEINIFENHVYGLERTRRNKEGGKDFRKFKKRLPRGERIKQKFRRMIDEGIPAFKAITYSELSENEDRAFFLARLQNDNSISEEQKNLIEKTCFE
jgi:hypothetical protein